VRECRVCEGVKSRMLTILTASERSNDLLSS
jgi:hypothetical protein